MSGERDLRNLEDAAAIIGVSLTTLRAWVRTDDFPVFERGSHGRPYRLDIAEVAAWVRGRKEIDEQRREEQAERDAQLRLEFFGDDSIEDDDGGKRLTPAEAEALHRAELARIRIAIHRSQLVNVDDFRAELAQAAGLVRDRLRALPDLMTETTGLSADQACAMAQAIDDTLDDLSNALTEMDRDRDVIAAAA